MAYNKKKHQFFSEGCIMEILLKLHIKSILKFRCVSKSWYALSTSSYFVNTHMKLNEKTEFLLISTYKNKILSFNLKDESLESELNPPLRIGSLVGYCNGIICFRLDYDIILLNPSTREFKVLPRFNTLLDIYDTGFGFDDLNDDYNVILFLFERNSIYEVAIYSFRSNTWRKLESKNINTLYATSEFVSLISPRISLFFNGRVHRDAYYIYYDDDRKISHRHPIILFMDISSEVFYEFQYPKPILLWKNKNTGYRDLSYK